MEFPKEVVTTFVFGNIKILFSSWIKTFIKYFWKSVNMLLKNKINKFINDELEITSDQFDQEVSNKEYIKTKYHHSVFFLKKKNLMFTDLIAVDLVTAKKKIFIVLR